MAEAQPRPGFQTPREVTDYFDQKGFRPAFSWLDVWGEEHAYAFTVAKATELELLTAFRTSISDALKNGQGFETWRAGLMPTLARLGWDKPRTVVDPTGERAPADVNFASPRRLRTIFWSNANAARSAGQWERAQRTKAGLPYILYVRTRASDPRKEHLGWVGIILPVDDAFWSTHWPPNGWGCKCSIRQVTGRERDRLLGQEPSDGGISYRDTPPDNGPPRIFTNARTGEVSEVPAGIDPGWGTNPGLSRAQTLVTRLTERLAEAGPEDARAAIVDLTASPVARVLAGLPHEVFMPVAIAPPTLTGELGASARVLEVSNRLIATEKMARPIAAADLADVQGVVDGGTIVDEGRPRQRAVFGEGSEGGLWRAVVKAADRGRRLLLSSFRAARDGEFEEAQARDRGL